MGTNSNKQEGAIICRLDNPEAGFELSYQN